MLPSTILFCKPPAILLAIVALIAGKLQGATMEVETEYKIWTQGAPGSNPEHWPWPAYKETWLHDNERNEDLVKWVTEPTVKTFLPEVAKNTGAAVLICPGGGYNILEIDKEGYKVARKLQDLGVAGIVLKYRHYDIFAARDDAQRAIRFVRSKAKEWGINPDAIGIGGFSAGGHLALNCVVDLSPKVGWTADVIDKIDDNPDFLMLIYPGIPKDFANATRIPPTFISAAADDDFAQECVPLFGMLQKLKIPAELHVYQNGGHGFGLGTPGYNCSGWIGLFVNWLRTNNFLRGK
jgi:acetyl esterase/lipase